MDNKIIFILAHNYNEINIRKKLWAIMLRASFIWDSNGGINVVLTLD
ncbi:hypothetical protein SCACP_09130 [Sporomusa carbonis]